MPEFVTLPFAALVSMRDILAPAKDSSVNPAYVCGQLHEALTIIIDRLKKEAPENEKTV